MHEKKMAMVTGQIKEIGFQVAKEPVKNGLIVLIGSCR